MDVSADTHGDQVVIPHAHTGAPRAWRLSRAERARGKVEVRRALAILRLGRHDLEGRVEVDDLARLTLEQDAGVAAVGV